MEINNLSYSSQTYAASSKTGASASTNPAKDKTAAEQAASTTDTASAEAGVYEASGKEKADKALGASDLKRMLEEADRQTKSMRDMIRKLFNRQAEKNGLANGQDPYLNEGEMIEIDAETRAKAQADIAEGGYYSVENTGDRIFDFAAAYAGNDPEKLKEMQKAVEKGFSQAEEMWDSATGSGLPQISQDTMAYVRDKFTKRFDELGVAQTAGA